ncbi:spermidine synthase [Plantactinospora siamensis]|uniref:Spermidine synthase n=1 Tax=Plantactinospora siamensis TaxID=555372 RepID=A0ABV6P2A6_9ACTN
MRTSDAAVSAADRGEPAPELDAARLVPDPDRPSGRTLLVEDVEQSYVDPADPTYLRFDYVRRMASVLDVAGPARTPLRVLHLGGGALTLPRYAAATRPGSPQLVVDRDGPLMDLIARELPPPPDVRVRVADAREAIGWEPDGRYDVVLVDVYRGARMPAHLTTVEFAAEAARVLRPDGLYAVNLTDLPPLVFTRVQVATLRRVFAEVCLVAARQMVRARRYGNVVLVASRREGRLPVDRLATRAARDPAPGRLLAGAELTAFAGGSRPAHDRSDAAPRGFPDRSTG